MSRRILRIATLEKEAADANAKAQIAIAEADRDVQIAEAASQRETAALKVRALELEVQLQQGMPIDLIYAHHSNCFLGCQDPAASRQDPLAAASWDPADINWSSLDTPVNSAVNMIDTDWTSGVNWARTPDADGRQLFFVS